MSLARILVTAVLGVVLGGVACGDSDETGQMGIGDGLVDCPPEGCAADGGATDNDAGPLVISRCTDGELQQCKVYLQDPAGGTTSNCYIGYEKCTDGAWGDCEPILDADNQPIVGVVDSSGNVVDPNTGDVLQYADGRDAGL